MILVSACLAGINCTYRGDSNKKEQIASLVSRGDIMLVCPEQLGGLTTPREAVEIVAGNGSTVLEGISRVKCASGVDVTDQFIRGAREVLKIAKLCGAECAVLKSRSPSCGKGIIHDGSFSGKLTAGNGVTAELLIQNGIPVFTEEEFISQHID